MVIEVRRNPPAVIVNGLRMETAPPVAALLGAIGRPTRIDTGPKPAPPGFRNNQQHVFDVLGVHVNEHHHTRRAQALGIALSVDEPRYGFTPASPFVGELKWDGVRMPLRATESEFLEVAPWTFEPFLAGEWHCDFDGFSVGFRAIGPKLASGGRGKRRVVVDVDVEWPHDPHGEPAGGG